MPVRIIEKPEEDRVFFEVTPPVRQGEHPVPFTAERDMAEALIAKGKYEDAHPAIMFVRFYRDPYAGGSVKAGNSMHSFPMWVGQTQIRTFPDEETAEAFRQAHK